MLQIEDPGLSAPASKSGRLQRHCLELLRARESVPDGLPTSARFIYYELVAVGVVAKQRRLDGGGRRPDQDVIDAIFRLRERGLIPWEWIVDETRHISIWSYGATVAAHLLDKVEETRLDRWAGERPPLILTESRSLAGVLDNLAYQYLAPISATNGQVGGHLRTEIAPQLNPGDRVLYLGDLDWQGGEIEANTRRVLEQRIGGELLWERLAITAEQVRRHHLPVIQKADRRYRPVRFHDAVETEALGQSIIVGIVRARLDELLPEPLAIVLEREQRQRSKVRAALAKLRKAG